MYNVNNRSRCGADSNKIVLKHESSEGRLSLCFICIRQDAVPIKVRLGDKSMSNQSLPPSGLSRLAAYLSLSLAVPIALCLCLLFKPRLDLPAPSLCYQQRGSETCEEVGLGPDIPDAPRHDLDAPRLFIAWRQYDYLQRCRQLSQTLLHSAHTTKEWRFVQNEVVQSEADFQRLYHEITPAIRGRAHLPHPDESAELSQEF